MSVVGIKALLVDENAAAPTGGLADGLDRRSFEVLDMFNLGSTIWKEAHQNVEVSYWVCPTTLKYHTNSPIISQVIFHSTRYLKRLSLTSTIVWSYWNNQSELHASKFPQSWAFPFVLHRGNFEPDSHRTSFTAFHQKARICGYIPEP